MLYLDASALVERYVEEEEGGDSLIETLQAADGWAMGRIGYVETARGIRLAGEGGR